MNPSKTAFIQKVETFATVDGPGIRTLFFLAGCPLRCLYCHNPETWQSGKGLTMDVEKLVTLVKRYKPYYGELGGVTFSGGEPLMQAEFIAEAFKRLKEEGIHTCLDTSGYSRSPYLPEILKHTDLILYDIKAAEPNLYRKITGQDMAVTDDFLALAQEHQVPLWIRQVVVPGLNDTKEQIDQLAEKIHSLRYTEKIELLPYHTLGVTKYSKLEIKYPLEGVPAMDIDRLKELEDYLFDQLQNR